MPQMIGIAWDLKLSVYKPKKKKKEFKFIVAWEGKKKDEEILS